METYMNNDNIGFRITLTKNDWEESIGGWRCPPLEIPGANVAAVFWLGKEVSKDWYEVRPDISAVRWSHKPIPEQVAVSIALTKDLSTKDLTLRWKKVSIVGPLVMAVVVVLLTAVVSRLSGWWDDRPPSDERAAVIQRFYNALNSQKYEDAWALIHPLRKAQIQQRVKDANDFKQVYGSTILHTNIKTTLETNDPREPVYMVGFDVQDDVLRSALYQLREQKVDEAVERGIINKDKIVDLVFSNLNDYFVLPNDAKVRIRDVIGKRRLSSLFSPVFVEEFASELGLDQRRAATLPLKDSVWRHFILKLTLKQDDSDWKIRSGLDKPLVAEYGSGANMLSK